MSGLTKGVSDRMFSMGIWSWLVIVEKEGDKLSEGAQSALALLREDLEQLAAIKDGQS
jgi:hypothetical protein